MPSSDSVSLNRLLTYYSDLPRRKPRSSMLNVGWLRRRQVAPQPRAASAEFLSSAVPQFLNRLFFIGQEEDILPMVALIDEILQALA